MIKRIIILFGIFFIAGTSLHYGSPFLMDKLLIVLGVSLLSMLVLIQWISEGFLNYPKFNMLFPVITLFAYLLIQALIIRQSNQRYVFESFFAESMIIFFLIYIYASYGSLNLSKLLIEAVLYTNVFLLLIYVIVYFSHFKTHNMVFSGWLVNHDHIAMLTGMLLPYALALSMYKRDVLKKRLFMISAVLVIGIGFLLSVSRGGYISFILAISITFLIAPWLRLYNKKTAVVMLVAVIAAGMFVLSLYPFEQRMFSKLFMLSASQRLGIWSGSVKMFMLHPFIGWGAGTYEDAFHRFRPAGILYLVNHAHNVFIEIADDTGGIGIAIILWIIVLWIYSLIKGIRSTKSNFKKLIIWAGLTSTLFLIFHNFVDFGIIVPSNLISALLLMSATLSVLQFHNNNFPPDYVKKLSARVRISMGIISIVLFLTLSILCVRAIYGDYLYKKGRAFFEQDKIADAKQTLIKSLKFLNTDKLHNIYGEALFQSFIRDGKQHELDDAIVQMKISQTLCTWNPYYPEDIGALYEYEGNIDSAVIYTQKSLSLDPTNASLALRLASLELEHGNTGKAISYYRRACNIYPPYVRNTIAELISHGVNEQRVWKLAEELKDGEWVLANTFIKQGENKQAIKILKRLIVSDNIHADRYLHTLVGIIPDSMKALKQIESLGVTNTTILFYEASLKARVNDVTGAIGLLHEIIDKDKKNKQAYELLTNLYVSTGRSGMAIQTLKNAIYYIPSNYSFYVMLGNLYGKDKDWYNALLSYKMAIMMNPRYEDGYVKIIRIYKEQGLRKNAQDFLNKALELFPNDTRLTQKMR